MGMSSSSAQDGLILMQAEILNEEVGVMQDEDGCGLVGMSVQSSCGRQEMEEGVRLIFGRWGLETGPRGGRDRGKLQMDIARVVADHACSRLDASASRRTGIDPASHLVPAYPWRLAPRGHQSRSHPTRLGIGHA